MKYISLNHNSQPVNFQTALINGLAPDKGLYFPEKIINLPKKIIENNKQKIDKNINFVLWVWGSDLKIIKIKGSIENVKYKE